MSIIGTGNHPKALWPGVEAFWGLEYNKHPDETKDLFDVKTSKKAYEEMVEATGFGLAQVKPQGGGITYTSHVQGAVTRAIHVVYGLGYIVTEEELDDNQYMELSQGRVSALAFSMMTTKNINGANVYNRAFNSSYTFGDGKELCATDHPTLSGDQSNELAVGAALSETSLEDLLVQIGQAKNSKGLQIGLRGESLHVPVNLMFDAERIMKSILQNDTSNNAVNAIRSMGLLPKGVKVNHYFTDTNNWFVRTNIATAGLTMFQRKAIAFARDNDFDTGNAKAKATERYSFTCGDFRSIYGSAPA